jgi:glycerate kinase
MENGMQNYAKVIKGVCKKDVSIIEGSGAGGGVAVPLLAFFDGKITSGINAILDAINFSDIIKDTDIIITGEGKIDRQSLFGKAISGVCERAKEKNIPVYCFVGGIGDDKEELLKMGIKDIYAVVERAKDITDAINNAKEYLYNMAKDFARFIKGESL